MEKSKKKIIADRFSFLLFIFGAVTSFSDASYFLGFLMSIGAILNFLKLRVSNPSNQNFLEALILTINAGITFITALQLSLANKHYIQYLWMLATVFYLVAAARFWILYAKEMEQRLGKN